MCIKTENEYAGIVKKLMTIPRGSTIEERLVKIRDSCPSEEDESENIEQDTHILPLNMFFELEEDILPEVMVKPQKTPMKNVKNVSKQTSMELNEEELELVNIHNKAIFDAFEEALQNFQNTQRMLMTSKNCLAPDHQAQGVYPCFEHLVDLSKKKVENWAQAQCGTIVKKEIEFENYTDLKTCEELIAQIKEERLALAVTTELQESHGQWLDIREQLHEVMDDVSEIVFDQIVFELANELIDKGPLRKN
jgi:hypothetical protein